MNCPNCNKETEVILTKAYPCKCGDIIEVNEHVCFACGVVFDEVAGEIIGDFDDTLAEVKQHFGVKERMTVEEAHLAIDRMRDTLDSIVGPDDYSMSSFTHKCLRCDSVCLDNGVGLISCKCGFEWEVISH